MGTMYIILALVVVMVALMMKGERITVYEDGIKISDFMYPMYVSNDVIKSIELLERIPVILARSNGANLGKMLKGVCKIKKFDSNNVEKVNVYLRDRGAQVIKINTVYGSVYINRKNNELTKELFDEMKNTVKILKENELNHFAKRPKALKSIIVVSLFFIVLLFFPFLSNYNNQITVNDDMIEIKGDYSMNIPIANIDTVLLVEKLPAIKLRTNGISTRKVNIGHFKTSDGRRCRLYVNNDVPLYIEIRRDVTPVASENQSNLIFINRKTVEETRMLYEEIFNSMYN